MQMEMQMNPILIDNDGAYNFIKKRYFVSDSEKICEILGCAPGEVNIINFEIKYGKLVITLNDGGLKDDDIIRLQTYFKGGIKGHSEWGMGSRVAAAELAKDAKISPNIFYILDKNRGLEFNYNSCESNIKSFGTYRNLTAEEIQKTEQVYRSGLENCDTNYTKWIIPVSDEFVSEANLTKIKNDLKFRYCMPIMKNQMVFKFKGEKITVNEQPYEINKWDDIEIFKAKNKKKNNKGIVSPYGNAEHMYKINDKIYSKDLNEIDKDSIENIETIHVFKASYYNPSKTRVDNICDEYKFKKTAFNGLIISKKDVLKSTKFVLASGQRNAGTDAENHIIICFKDEKNNLCSSNAEKNHKPMLNHAVKDFLDSYKKINNCKKSSKSKTNIIENNTITNDYEKEEQEEEEEEEEEDEEYEDEQYEDEQYEDEQDKKNEEKNEEKNKEEVQEQEEEEEEEQEEEEENLKEEEEEKVSRQPYTRVDKYNVKPEYIYLVKEREFRKTEENIFKIGMTQQENSKRFNQYSKDSTLLIQLLCKDCKNIEKKLINLFKEKFKNRQDIGDEFFEGDSSEMIKIIFSTIEENGFPEVPKFKL